MYKEIRRRQFVKNTITGALGLMTVPMIVPAKVVPGKGRTLPNDRINLGFIGVGRMGMNHLKAFLEYDDVRIIAIGDVKKWHCDEAKKTVDARYSNADCDTYNDYRELLARKDVDAIVTATPDHWHALVGVEAARQGKAMYFEKPLALTVEECKILRKAVNKSKICFQHGTQQRSDERFRFAVEMVRNGKLGEIKRIVVESTGCKTAPFPPEEPVPKGFDYDRWLGPAPEAPYSELRCSIEFMNINDYSLGGLSGAWGVHHIDIVQWALDADNSGPVVVEGIGTRPTEGIFNNYNTYEVEHIYPNDVKLLYIDLNSARAKIPQLNRPSSMAILFEGSEGWIYVSRQMIDAHPKSLLDTKFGPNDFRLPFSTDHRRNFLDGFRNGTVPIGTIESGVRSEYVCQQAYIALTLGQKLYWDNKKERFIDNEAANQMLSRPRRSHWEL